jgi:hypothetical protein
MAQISRSLYAQISLHYANIWTFLDSVEAEAQAAVYHIVDVISTTYTPCSDTTPFAPAAASATAALEIELELLDVFNAAYISVGGIASSSSSLLDGVRAMNNHVINNYPNSTQAPTGYHGTRATTPDGKLADFVHLVRDTENAATEWADGCVPRGWYELSTQAGYDCSDWYYCLS